MKVVVESKFQPNLELLISKLESIPDNQFDMDKPIVDWSSPSPCGCIDAWAGVVLREHSVNVDYSVFESMLLLGIDRVMARYIFWARFSEKGFEVSRQEAIDYLKTLRNNSEKEG